MLAGISKSEELISKTAFDLSEVNVKNLYRLQLH